MLMFYTCQEEGKKWEEEKRDRGTGRREGKEKRLRREGERWEEKMGKKKKKKKKGVEDKQEMWGRGPN